MNSRERDRCASVIIPSTGTRPLLLKQALASVHRQTGVSSLEVIVVDASGERRITADDLVEHGPTSVVYPSEPLTAGRARQFGGEAASFEWIAYFDDDDLWAPTKLARQFEVVEVESTRWCFTGAMCFTSDLQVLWPLSCTGVERIANDLRHGNAVRGGGSSCMVQKSLLAEAGGWDPDLRNSEDWDMWIRLAQLGQPSYVHEPLVGVRLHGGSKSLNVDRIRTSHEAIRAKYPVGFVAEPQLDWMYRRELALGQMEQAAAVYAALENPNWRTALLRGAAAVSGGAVSRALRWRERSRVPSDWEADALAWLSQYSVSGRVADEVA
jgi:glycosyltransferase involved in cell wall biosynthesis